MKTGEMLTVTALAIAAGLVLIPKRTASSAGAGGGFRNVFAPRVGAGDGSTVWTDARTAQYREQLARSVGNDWTGP